MISASTNATVAVGAAVGSATIGSETVAVARINAAVTVDSAASS